MQQYFLIGEFAKLHNISKQTLIFYDKIGLLKPIYYDETTGYRYYSSDQLEIVDSIFILKEIGVPLKEIKIFLDNRSLMTTIDMLKGQKNLLDQQINQLISIRKRLDMKLEIFEKASLTNFTDEVAYIKQDEKYLYVSTVSKPYDSVCIDLAIKDLLKDMTNNNYPYNYQVGTSTPLERIKSGDYDLAGWVFTYLDNCVDSPNLSIMPKGLYASIIHVGPYRYESQSYQKLVETIKKDGYIIDGPSYSECIIDNLAEAIDAKYITRIMIKVVKASNSSSCFKN